MQEIFSSNDLAIQIIVAAASILTTLITLRYKDKIADRLRTKPAPDRIEFIYDGYENLIRELKTQLDTALVVNERQHEEIIKTREKAERLHDQLKEQRAINLELTQKLQRYEQP